jgi:hypothetical protein
MTFTRPIPFTEAITAARQKQELPTTLSSDELRRLSGALRRRSVFSARLSLAEPLQVLRNELESLLTQEPDELGRMRSIPEVKARLLESLTQRGYVPPQGFEGSLLDHTSDARLSLIVETNVLDTLGAGRFQAGQDPVAIEVNPGWELVRVSPARVPRDWQQRWEDAGGTLLGGRMVALKNDPIWQALGDGVGGYTDTLGNPWPPFAFSSGMNVVEVSADECEALGIDVSQAGPADNPGLNDNLEASAERFDEELQAALDEDPEIEVSDGVLTLRNRAPGRALVRQLVEVLA